MLMRGVRQHWCGCPGRHVSMWGCLPAAVTHSHTFSDAIRNVRLAAAPACWSPPGRLAGELRFKLLAVDVPCVSGGEQRIYLEGGPALYERGGVLSVLRDPFIRVRQRQGGRVWGGRTSCPAARACCSCMAACPICCASCPSSPPCLPHTVPAPPALPCPALPCPAPCLTLAGSVNGGVVHG